MNLPLMLQSWDRSQLVAARARILGPPPTRYPLEVLNDTLSVGWDTGGMIQEIMQAAQREKQLLAPTALAGSILSSLTTHNIIKDEKNKTNPPSV